MPCRNRLSDSRRRGQRLDVGCQSVLARHRSGLARSGRVAKDGSCLQAGGPAAAGFGSAVAASPLMPMDVAGLAPADRLCGGSPLPPSLYTGQAGVHLLQFR